jgi:hypothetical protein
MREDVLERRLRELGGRLAFPSVDVAGAVGARVREATSPHARVIALPRSRAVRRGVAAAVAAVLLLGGAALAGRLGVPGLRVIFSPGPAPTNVPIGTHLFLGRLTTLEDARKTMGFHVVVPHGQDLGPPSVYVGDEPPGGRVSLVYATRPGLPRSSFTRAGLLVSQFQASVDESYVKKLTFTGTRVRNVDVNGAPGWWIAGAPHVLVYVDRNGSEFEDSLRLAGNTLVWSNGEVTVRLECACGLRTALAIAQDVR